MAERNYDLGLVPRLRPQARPIDTFTPAAEENVAKPGNQQGLEQLAQALDHFGKGVDQYAQSEHKRYTEAEIKAGEAARLKNQGQFKELVSKGVIPEGASPWFKLGFDTQEGRLAGMDYDVGMRTAWSTSPVKDSDNPEDLNKWMAEYRANFVKARGGVSAAYLDGLNPMMERAHTNLSAQHVAHRQAEISAKVRENTGREVMGLLRAEIEQQAAYAMYSEEVFPEARWQALGQTISGRLTAMVQNGLNGRDANQIAIDSIAAMALDFGDARILDVMKHINTGSGSLGSTQAAKEAYFKTSRMIREMQRDEVRWSNSIESHEWARESHKRRVEIEWPHADEAYRRAREQQQREDIARTASVRLVLDIARNPVKALDPKVLEDLIAADPFMAERVIAIRENALDRREKVRENDPWIQAQYKDITNNPWAYDERRIIDGGAKGYIDSSRMIQMLSDLRARRNESDSGTPMGSKDYKDIRNALRSAVERGKIGQATGSSTENAQHAVEDLDDFAREWLSKNQNADLTSPSFRIEMRKKRDELHKRYNELGDEETVRRQEQDAADGKNRKAVQQVPSELRPIIRGLQAEQKELLGIQASGSSLNVDERILLNEKKLKFFEQLSNTPAKENKGKLAVDPETGLKYRSDGFRWNPAR